MLIFYVHFMGFPVFNIVWDVRPFLEFKRTNMDTVQNEFHYKPYIWN